MSRQKEEPRMKNAEEFRQDMKNDKELFRTLSAKAEEDAQGDATRKQAAYVAAAREKGYDITVEELLLLQALEKELDEDELMRVAGGKVKCFGAEQF